MRSVFPIVYESARRRFLERPKVIEICEKEGRHISSGKGAIVNREGYIRVYHTCDRCGASYDMPPTERNVNDYQKTMGTEGSQL